jgi:serine/threonine-protein kinase
MPAVEQLLDDLADAVLDGGTVDWVAAESSADAASRPIVQHLRLVASVARLHRNLVPEKGSPVDGAAMPDRWGHLRLVERIGRGAFGEVFRAWDSRLDREVALKLLPAPPPSGSDAESSIIREGRLLAKVRHPNVVTIYGAEQIGVRIGLWMEFVRGDTLEHLLQKGTIFDEAEAVAIGAELCRAVSAVHAAGLLHRDIKAHNVMRAEDGRIVLMDFGAGRELDADSSSDLTGTPLYLAPEVLAGGPATIQSDVYSLGVLLYHLVTGSYPVKGRTVRDVRLAHERSERIGIRRVRPRLRPALARAIERAIDPRPEGRYENVDAVRDALRRNLEALQPRPVIRRLAYGLAAAAFVVLVALLAWEIRARMTGDDRSMATRLASLFPGPEVIVVQPFKNPGGHVNGELLADSITDGLNRQLSIIPGLETRSQYSSLKNGPRDLANVSRLLSADLVVVGDVQFSGSTLLITAALVSVGNDRELWTDTFERRLESEGDVVGVIEDLTRAIVNELRLKPGRTQRRYDTDIDTFLKYRQALELRDRRRQFYLKGIPLLEEMTRSDSPYAPALAVLATAYGDQAALFPDADGNTIPLDDAVAKMAPLIKQALEADPRMAEAHAALGYLRAIEQRWMEAEESFREAIELEPSMTNLYVDFVHSTLLPWGRLEESLETLEKALEVDPLSLNVRRSLGIVQLFAGLYPDAELSCQSLLADPTFGLGTSWCLWVPFFNSERDKVPEQMEKFALTERGRLVEGATGWLHAIRGQRVEAYEIAAQLDWLPPRQAEIYGLLRDTNRVFVALERLAVMNPLRAGSELSNPVVGLRGDDPRVVAFRRKLRFPPTR